MPNKILTVLDSVEALTITLASLADGAARQSSIVDNSVLLRPAALVTARIKTSGTTNDGSVIEIYLFRLNANDEGDDEAGLSDAAITINNMPLLGTIVLDSTSPKTYAKTFDTAFLGKLGDQWGIAIKNNTSDPLSSTEADSIVEVTPYVPEIQ